jgi:hypothetical protein
MRFKPVNASLTGGSLPRSRKSIMSFLRRKSKQPLGKRSIVFIFTTPLALVQHSQSIEDESRRQL